MFWVLRFVDSVDDHYFLEWDNAVKYFRENILLGVDRKTRLEALDNIEKYGEWQGWSIYLDEFEDGEK
jgi:hypothetical protein